MKRAVKYAIIGCLLGMPLSYFFQSEMVQNLAGGITGYIIGINYYILNFIYLNGDLNANFLDTLVNFSIIGSISSYSIAYILKLRHN